MRRFMKSAVALLAVSALPLIAVAPASATSPNVSDYTIDCDEYVDGYDQYYPALYGTSATITLLNCETVNLYDWADSGTASTNNGTLDAQGNIEVDEATEVITVTGEAQIEIWDVDNEANGFDRYFEYVFPYEMPDPSGVQLADSSQLIAGTDPAATTYGTAEEIDAGEEIGIGGDTDGCGIRPGEHVYATQDIHVSETGEYTFRVTGTDPVADHLYPYAGANTPLRDPMVALYSTFDPNDPNVNNVSCNDDLNDLTFGDHNYNDNDFNITQQGDKIEGHFSYLTANLEPGNYTLVFTTWDSISAADWAAGDANNGDYTWTPGDGSIYFDIWGPEAGLTLGHELASTGVDPSFGLWTGLALAGTGVAITVARRRAQRA